MSQVNSLYYYTVYIYIYVCVCVCVCVYVDYCNNQDHRGRSAASYVAHEWVDLMDPTRLLGLET